MLKSQSHNQVLSDVVQSVTNLVQFFQSVGQSVSQSVSQAGSQELISVVRSRSHDHEDSRAKKGTGFVTPVLIDLIR